MALKALLLKKQIDNKRKALDALRANIPTFEAREAELTRAIDEVETDEQRSEVEALIAEFEQTRAGNEEAIAGLEAEIRTLEGELAAEEENQRTDPPAEARHNRNDPHDTIDTQRREAPVITRIQNPRVNLRDRVSAIVTRDDVRLFADSMRSLIGQKRAVSGSAVTIPEVMLPMIRELVETNSLMLKYVNVQNVHGTARQVIMGTIPEAVWTEMCAKLNELDLSFNDAEVDGYKVGAFIGICNALKEDNDVELVTQIVFALGRAEALAVDKAILYGTGTKMPMGIVTRLAQTEAPASARATDRPWVDLHTSNIQVISVANTSGVTLFKELMKAFGAAKKKYGAGGKFWAMNEKTHAVLVTEAFSINAAGAIVSGVNDTMPVIGGDIVELDFIPDNIIICGYGENYLMAQRAGRQIGQSEHVRFIEDQTVFKSTARYDGLPVIAESFVAIGINNTSVSADAVSFEPDAANSVDAIRLNTSTASIAVGGTVRLKAITSPGTGTVTWASATEAKATVSSDGVVTGVAAGSSVITATCNGLTASCTVTVTSA